LPYKSPDLKQTTMAALAAPLSKHKKMRSRIKGNSSTELDMNGSMNNKKSPKTGRKIIAHETSSTMFDVSDESSADTDDGMEIREPSSTTIESHVISKIMKSPLSKSDAPFFQIETKTGRSSGVMSQVDEQKKRFDTAMKSIDYTDYRDKNSLRDKKKYDARSHENKIEKHINPTFSGFKPKSGKSNENMAKFESFRNPKLAEEVHEKACMKHKKTNDDTVLENTTQSAEAVSATDSPSSFAAYLAAKRATSINPSMSRQARHARCLNLQGEERDKSTSTVIEVSESAVLANEETNESENEDK